MKRNPTSLLLAFALSGSGVFAQINTTDDYPNVAPGTPLSIKVDGTASANGRINYADDKDVMNFQVGNNGGVTIYTTGTTDTNGVLRRQTSAGWTTIATEEGGTGNFRISRILDPGLYSIQVGGKLANAAGAVGGDYVLKVEIVPPTPPAPPDIEIPEAAIGGSLSFGAIPVNTVLTKNITIKNTGASTLLVTGVTITGGSNAAGGVITNGPFFLEGGAARTILPGASSQMTFVFRPSAAGNFAASVGILSNDPDENPWTFSLTGSGAGTPPPPGAPEIAMMLGTQEIPTGGLVDFGPVNLLGAPMALRELVISNTGTSDLHLGAVKIQTSATNGAAVPADYFRVVTPPADVVGPGRTTVLRFSAGSVAVPTPASGSLRLTALATVENDDADENPYRLQLAATIVGPNPAAGEIAVFSGDAEIQDDGVLDLGATRTGAPIERTVTIKNTGTSDLRISGITVEWNGPVIAIFPPPAPPFRVEGVEARTVAPGGATTCRVIFPASAEGAAEANLVIASSDADENPFTVLLKAKAEGSVEPPAAPEIAVKLESQDLPIGGTVDFGRTSLTVPVKRTVTIANTGTGPLLVRSVIQPLTKTPAAAANAANGALLPAAPFRFSGEPVNRVEAGASKPLTIVFQPVSNGSYQAVLLISNNDADENPYKLKLTGTGGTDPNAVPDIALSLGDANLPQGGLIDFGSAAPGASVTKEVRIRNTGTGDLLLGRISFQSSSAGNADPAAGGIAVNGAVILPPVGALPFRVLPPPNNAVPAGGSAVLRVVYVAPASGTQEAGLLIESNDPDESPYRLKLVGRSNGTVPTPPDIAISSGDAELPAGGTLSFGTVLVGAPVRREITVANTGGGELRIFGFSILPADALANDALLWTPPNALVRVVSGPGSIAAGASGKFVLEMIGFSAGPAKLQARISSNDPDENPYSFGVTGEVSNPVVVDPLPPVPAAGNAAGL